MSETERHEVTNKPPLGVSPHWFVYLKRIEELHEAIGRYIEYVHNTWHMECKADKYKAIAGWAKEIENLALLEAELEINERGKK